MLNKKNTIRMRVSLYSLLVMIVVLVATVATVYILQQTDESMINSSENSSIIKDPQLDVQIIMTKVEDQQKNLFLNLVGISSIILILASLVIYFLTKRELKPLEKLKEEITGVNFQKQGNKIVVNSKREEIISLANTFNEMLSNLESSYFMQQKFAQNAAHELKTPITIMKTTTQVARLTKNNDILDTIEEQVSRMNQLVQSLLKLNKQRELNLEIVNVKSLIEDVVSNLNSKAAEKSINVSIEGKMEIQSDPNILELIFNNIIENAIKYNKVNGQVKIILGETIQIIDSGIGINQEEINAIFTPFYCVDESRSKELGGFGLGLSIVKECLAYLGYSYKLTSIINEGTTFEIIPKKDNTK